jgi:hypothetical protein
MAEEIQIAEGGWAPQLSSGHASSAVLYLPSSVSDATATSREKAHE